LKLQRIGLHDWFNMVPDSLDMSLLLQTQTRLIEQERNYVRALKDLRLAEIDYLLAMGYTSP